MVEVFKTNIMRNEDANNLTALICQHYPDCKVNFDLEDCDKILRVVGQQIEPEAIIILAKVQGYIAEQLPD